MNEQELLQAIGKMLDQRLQSIQQDISTMKQDMSSMKQDIRDNRILIENNVMRDIHLIAEQHADIIERLNAIADYGETKGRVSTLEHVVQSHSEDIKELQKRIG
ncbi:hypothetical protein [Marasmitruncus massiliensis]|uniref:hypothetical protein n=1 Tax=Marasmitruncus massiliensis TaxID=1944642 RepID=UPI000C7D4A9C|nr:hypothetical protein [Marasmitruncus massiliensis]